MSKQTEALKLALEALQHEADTGNDDAYKLEREAIKEALAQPTSGDYALGYAEGFNDACKKTEQEPVESLWQHGETGRTRIITPDMVTDCDASWFKAADLYTTPPKRQPLTDAQKQAVKFEIKVKQSGASIGDFDYLLESVIKATEAAHDIKEQP